MSCRTQAPQWLYFAAVDRTTDDGVRLSGVAVSGACLSKRGARKHLRRLRQRHPDAYVEGRRTREMIQAVQS
jgi:hypothetical protein